MKRADETMPGVNQRTLKIEALGDFGRPIKPRIRLSGYWLARAGFKPGHRVDIQLLKPGAMTLQCKEEPASPPLDNAPAEKAEEA
jgi:hypothetical protein